MMWMRLPETRRFLARLMTKEVEAAIDRDCELMLLAGDIASAASWHPVMCPALGACPHSIVEAVDPELGSLMRSALGR